ncbi:MAG: hypothetical protein JW737_07225 [Acidobacteria bacterium]|nr:hypothetical protein [Acidobacteriota bacterium]
MTQKKLLALLLLTAFLFTINSYLFTQDFDYHREYAPVPSWNNFPLFDASMAACGGVSLFASDRALAIANPALINNDIQYSFGISYDFIKSQAFQYSIWNASLYFTDDYKWDNFDHFSSISGSYSLGNISVAAGWYKNKLYYLPYFQLFDSSSEYNIFGEFDGNEDAFFLALSVEPIKNLDIGIKITYLDGFRTVDLLERYSDSDISQYEDYSWNYMIISGGIAFKPIPYLIISGTFDINLEGTIDQQIDVTFDASRSGGSTINTSYSMEDPYQPPNKFSAGAKYTFVTTNKEGIRKPILNIGVEAAYTDWESYQHISFGEDISEEYQNTLELAVGAEALLDMGGFNWAFRTGLRIDPQPLVNPEATINWYTFGFGIVGSNLDVNLAFLITSADMDFADGGDSVIMLSLNYRK